MGRDVHEYVPGIPARPVCRARRDRPPLVGNRSRPYQSDHPGKDLAMMDQPSVLELVTAVRDFLEQRAMPELKGHTAFHARVAANALGIVARELEQGGPSADAERERLAQLLGHDGSLMDLNRELCRKIR